MKVKLKVLSAVLVFLLLPAYALAQDIIVTRNFTGLWDQTEHESQGINLQIIHQASGEKVAVVYWFTYDDNDESAWFLGVGGINGNRIEMILSEGREIEFLESNKPGNDRVVEVGTMTIEFSSCYDGMVEFETDIAAVGGGSFPIERFTDIHNTRCSGGISDDTPSNIISSEQRIGLSPARSGINGSGHADFEQRADRTEFSVEVEDLADGSYRIFVGETDRGELVVNMGIGETEFRSPVETGKVLLTFDPRGMEISVRDSQGAVLTSGDTTFGGGGMGGGSGGGAGGGTGGGGCTMDCNSGLDFGSVLIEAELNNTGVFAEASGDAKLEPRDDRTDFSVEIEDVPEGSYDLRIDGNIVGSIQAVLLQDGTIEGEVEFRNPVEPGKILLNFDPRGKQIDVLDGSTVILETLFPTG
ncbi:MAG: hypothetical protein KJO92_06595 [Gammaproteobacteria bacterium]|nr:hypothetical protein [Gammaproteobacteria bacterium]